MISEAALAELKLRSPCDQIARQWVKLRRHGKKFIGPCPLHSPDPAARDSTSFECDADGFVCAVCHDGGDVIRLVMKREGVDFVRAIELLGGTAEPDAERAAELEREQQRRRNKREQEANAFRERERRAAFDIWHRGANWRGTPVEEYLRRCRGLELLPDGLVLRYAPQVAYFHGEAIDEAGRRSPRVIWRGPAMLAPIVDASGKFRAVHCTWLDLESDDGKAEIKDDPGGSGKLPSKKVRGSKAGNVIRLAGPLSGNPAAAEASAGDPAPLTLYVGEGIETVLSVWCGLNREGEDLSRAIFRSAVDLGNLAGKSLESVPHPSRVDVRGRVRRVPGPQPDLTAPGIDIPAEVDRLVLLGDSDGSDPDNTRMALARAAARYARPGLTIVGAFAPDDKDFNDALRDQQAIRPIINAAAPIEVPEIPHHAQRRRKGRADRLSGAATAAGNGPPGAPSSGSDQAAPGAAQIATGMPAAAAAPVDASGPDGPRAASCVAAGAPPAGDNVIDFPGSSSSDDGGDDALDLRLAFYPQTDLGNAERFRERNRGKFLWCPAIGWLYWDGKRWNRDDADEHVKIAEHLTVRGIQREAEALADSPHDIQVGSKRAKGARKKDKAAGVKEAPDGDIPIMMSDALANWGRASEGGGHMAQIAENAAPYLAIAPDKLDADPFKFNVANGTLVFSKRSEGYVALRPHNPADLITKISPVLFDPKATCPGFDAFFSSVQKEEEVRRLILQWHGYSLTGDMREQKFCNHWGEGSNGKSVFVELCAYIAGEYSQSVPVETFLYDGKGRSPGQASPDLARMPGVRFLRTSEPPRGARLAEGQIKLATGGEPITARHLNKGFFEFLPEFKLTISGNHKLRILSSDYGIRRRKLFIPWREKISGARVDGELKNKLIVEASGILNRLLDGLRDWLDNGLILPPSIMEAAADYWSDNDPAGEFLRECVVPAEGERVKSSRMHAVYTAWAKANATEEWSEKGLSRALKDRSFVSKRSNGMWWLDVKLVKAESDFVDFDGKPHADDPAEKAANDDTVDF